MVLGWSNIFVMVPFLGRRGCTNGVVRSFGQTIKQEQNGGMDIPWCKIVVVPKQLRAKARAIGLHFSFSGRSTP